MIDLRLIRDDPELVKRAARDKNLSCDVDRILAVDVRRRELETEFGALRHQQNLAGERIARASREEKAALSAEMGQLKSRLREIEEEKSRLETELHELLLRAPQIPAYDEGVPVGADASANVPVRQVGIPRRAEDFGFPFRDHVELGLALGLFDLDRGVKIAGSRNYVLTGHGAILHEAVLRLAWDLMLRREYPRESLGGSADDSPLRFTPLTVPVLVTERLMVGTGFFPLHREEVYVCERDAQALVGTAEVPVTGLHADEILRVDQLPRLYVARSTCFRREAGAAAATPAGCTGFISSTSLSRL